MDNFARRIFAVLLTAVAIGVPLLNFAPKLYSWFLRALLGKLYVRIRGVQTQLERELTAPQVAVLQGELENINRAVHILPMRHSDLFLSVKGHIKGTRADLASRLVELRSA